MRAEELSENYIGSHIRHEIIIEDKHYKKYIKDLNIRDRIRGHAMILIDLTENYNMMEQLKEAKLHAEEANESKYQSSQPSSPALYQGY